MTISDLPLRDVAVVSALSESSVDDADASEICSRLHDIGFIAGERVSVLARAPGGDPMVVHVGQSRFALRRYEAQFVCVEFERGTHA
jgi:ferrous iron transport protein A